MKAVLLVIREKNHETAKKIQIRTEIRTSEIIYYYQTGEAIETLKQWKPLELSKPLN